MVTVEVDPSHFEDIDEAEAKSADPVEPPDDPGDLDDFFMASPGECNDAKFNHRGYSMSGTYQWYFNKNSTPAGLSADTTETKLRDATTNVTGVSNVCGFADNVSATHGYQGTTTRRTNISQVACGSNPDGYSVTKFGDLDALEEGKPIPLMATCVWLVGDDVVESDMKINEDDFKWTNTPVGCTTKWVIEGVATHERGHTFGMGHVGEKKHGKLTMSERSEGPCQNSESSLGKGDKLGLENLY